MCLSRSPRGVFLFSATDSCCVALTTIMLWSSLRGITATIPYHAFAACLLHATPPCSLRAPPLLVGCSLSTTRISCCCLSSVLRLSFEVLWIAESTCLNCCDSTTRTCCCPPPALGFSVREGGGGFLVPFLLVLWDKHKCPFVQSLKPTIASKQKIFPTLVCTYWGFREVSD